MSSSLRDEFSGATSAPVPPFGLLLPRGWVSEPATRETIGRLARQASAVFRTQHRPDLDARFQAMMARAADDLLKRDPVRVIYPADVPPEELFPLSIVAVRLTDPSGGPLDARVHELVRSRDARLLDDEGMILRWSTDDSVRVDGGQATVRSFNYLVSIPATERRQALLFTGVLVTGAGETLDASTIDGAQALMDAIMSTFQWSR